MKYIFAISLFAISCLPMNAAAPTAWQAKLQQELPLLGHRNWIVIVDSAYPLQTSPGIETIETGTDQITVVRDVLNALAKAPQVRPVVYMDAELPFLGEQQAPGVTQYRRQIKTALGSLHVTSVLHDQLIRQMGQAGGTFHVLILKTTLTVPYTSVFLWLNCKYWSDAAEKQLREGMKGRVPASPTFGPQ